MSLWPREHLRAMTLATICFLAVRCTGTSDPARWLEAGGRQRRVARIARSPPRLATRETSLHRPQHASYSSHIGELAQLMAGHARKRALDARPGRGSRLTTHYLRP